MARTPRKKPSGIRKDPTLKGRTHKKQNVPPAVELPKRGRPSAYKIEFDEMARRNYLLGYDDGDCAEFLGISIDTLHEWIKTKPTFSAARKDGKDRSDREVEAALRDRAVGYKHKEEKVFLGPNGKIVVYETDKQYPPDTKAAELWLNNRQGTRWKDRRVVENTGEVGIKITVTGGLPPPETENDE